MTTSPIAGIPYAQYRMLRAVARLFLAGGTVAAALGAANPSWIDSTMAITIAICFQVLARSTLTAEHRGTGWTLILNAVRGPRLTVSAAARTVLNGLIEAGVGVFIIVVAHDTTAVLLLFGGSTVGAIIAAVALTRVIRAVLAAQLRSQNAGER